MNSDGDHSGKPLVVAVYSVPLLCEALSATLEDIAEVRGFPAGRGDTLGLLRVLRPDAIVVDAEDEAEAVSAFADESHVPILHISLKDRKLRWLKKNIWQEAEGESSPEEIRNLLVAGVYARGNGR